MQIWYVIIVARYILLRLRRSRYGVELKVKEARCVVCAAAADCTGRRRDRRYLPIPYPMSRFVAVLWLSNTTKRHEGESIGTHLGMIDCFGGRTIYNA